MSSPVWASGFCSHLAARARGADAAVTGTLCPTPCQPSPVAPGHGPGVTAPWESRATGGKTERARSSPESGHGVDPGVPLPWDIAASPWDPVFQHPPATSRCQHRRCHRPPCPQEPGSVVLQAPSWARSQWHQPRTLLARSQPRRGAAAGHVPAPCASTPACQARRKHFIY